MTELRNEYIRLISLYKRELSLFSEEKRKIKEQNAFYPTYSLDAKIADRKRKVKHFMQKYEATYHVQI